MPDNLLSSSYGIPSSLLESLTATTGDVLSGKTYLGSDGEAHSGTMTDRAYGTGTSFAKSGSNVIIDGLPEGHYASGAEARLALSTFVTNFASVFKPTQVFYGTDNGNTDASTNFSDTYAMTKNQILLFVGNIGCSEGHHPTLTLSTPNCTQLYNVDLEHAQDYHYQANRLLIRIVKVNSNGNATMKGAAPTTRSSLRWYVVRLVG